MRNGGLSGRRGQRSLAAGSSAASSGGGDRPAVAGRGGRGTCEGGGGGVGRSHAPPSSRPPTVWAAHSCGWQPDPARAHAGKPRKNHAWRKGVEASKTRQAERAGPSRWPSLCGPQHLAVSCKPVSRDRPGKEVMSASVEARRAPPPTPPPQARWPAAAAVPTGVGHHTVRSAVTAAAPGRPAIHTVPRKRNETATAANPAGWPPKGCVTRQRR